MKRFTLGSLDKSPQRSDLVYHSLLSAILENQLKPGVRLRVEKVANELDVSTTPVREALSRLSEDGLVEKVPYQGYSVRTFSRKDVTDVFETRAALESYAAKLCAERRSEEDAQWLKHHLRWGQEALESGDFAAYTQYNEQLHQQLVTIPQNAALLGMWRNVHNQFRFFAKKTISIRERPYRAVTEHCEIADAILSKNAGSAQSLTERHILSALSDMLQAMDPPEPSQIVGKED